VITARVHEQNYRVSSYGLIVNLAKECADSKTDWDSSHAYGEDFKGEDTRAQARAFAQDYKNGFYRNSS
jgi:hypothetical protein